MGIEPDWSTYTPGAIFDMEGGIFRNSPTFHRNFLNPEDAAAAFAMRRMTLHNAGLFNLSRTDRNRILDALLRYYRIHFPTLGTLNSLKVLRNLFDF